MRFLFAFFGALRAHALCYATLCGSLFAQPVAALLSAFVPRPHVASLRQFASLLFTGTLEFIRVPYHYSPKQLKVSKLALGLLLMLGCWSCAPEAPSSSDTVSLLGPDLLPGSTYTIDPSQDTLLEGPAGVQLFIPAGAFGATTQPVSLEVIAALSLEDMVLGGLTTVTNDRNLLESSGMIYVQASQEGKQLSLHKDIQITLPTAVRPGSKVFSGILDNNKISWEESHEKNNSNLDQQILAGEQLYFNNCSSCHSTDLTRDLTGPALGWVLFHKDKEWIKRFIYNTKEVIASGDPYANQLYVVWNKANMNAFTSFDSTDLENIVTYLYNSVKLQQFDTTGLREKLRNDSLQFEQYKANREAGLEIKGFDFGQMPVFYKPTNPIENIFYMKKLGWANIDRFYNDPRTEARPFAVAIDNMEKEAQVFIVLKKQQMFLPAYKTKEGNYSFTHGEYEKLTTFPIGEKATIFAHIMGEETFFAIKEITIGNNEVEKLTLRVSNKEAILQTLKSTF